MAKRDEVDLVEVLGDELDKKPQLNVGAAVGRLSAYEPKPTLGERIAALSPRKWSPTAKTIATAGITAALVAAKAPAAVVAAITAWLFGG